MALLISALRVALSKIPTVPCAAAVNAALMSGDPAPGALLSLRKMVTCFLAATAITMTAWVPVPGAINCTGFTLVHLAAIFHTLLVSLSVVMCMLKKRVT